MTPLRRARRITIAFFVLYTAAMIFPGVVPFRGPRPFILGLPFGMVWATAWIIASFFVLLHVDRAYRDAGAGSGDEER